ncbi:MAG: class I SAM-dependent methyltransferase [Planctomycetota bacterium]|jgi:SAM-dependent methyltransferase
MDFKEHNRSAWDKKVEQKNPWTIPVTPEAIAAAREGKWQVLLTTGKPVPREWFPDLKGLDLLCLAGGGGQQGPIFAAAGARVTVFDLSPRQVEQDRLVAERDGLDLETRTGDMADLGIFEDESFDLVFHPISNCYVHSVIPVWKEAYRVLRQGGLLLAGLVNPVVYLFDDDPEHGNPELKVAHALPYSDLESLPDEKKKLYRDQGIPFEFGHTRAALIGNQLDAGFVLTGFYEDDLEPREDFPLSKFTPTLMATRAIKM